MSTEDLDGGGEEVAAEKKTCGRCRLCRMPVHRRKGDWAGFKAARAVLLFQDSARL